MSSIGSQVYSNPFSMISNGRGVYLTGLQMPAIGTNNKYNSVGCKLNYVVDVHGLSGILNLST